VIRNRDPRPAAPCRCGHVRRLRVRDWSISALRYGILFNMALPQHLEDFPVGDSTDPDLDHMVWIANTIDLVGPFAALEARLDKALECTSFTGQMAAMEDSLNVDPSKLPPALYAKWDRLLTRIAETTFFGQCAPLDQ